MERALESRFEHPDDIAAAVDQRERVRRYALLLEQLLRSLIPANSNQLQKASLRALLYLHRKHVSGFEAARACSWIRNDLVHGLGHATDVHLEYAEDVFQRAIEELLASNPGLYSYLTDRRKPESKASHRDVGQKNDIINADDLQEPEGRVVNVPFGAVITNMLASPRSTFLSPDPPDPLKYSAYSRISHLIRRYQKLTPALVLAETNGDDAQALLLLGNTLKALGFLESFQRSFAHHVGERPLAVHEDYVQLLILAVEAAWEIPTCRRCGGHGIFLGLCYGHWTPGGKTF